MLRGEFALAVRDEARETLLAVRDPVGIYSLYYAEANGSVLLSPSIDTLLAQPEVSNDLNRAALADHLSNRWPDPGETYFEAIRRVPPGHVLKVQGQAREVSRYWNPAPEGDVRWVEPDELERFDALMEQAVSRALELGPAGIFLSGGLDSVSVAAFAADTCRRRELPGPLALSLVFPDADANEEPVQRGVAADLGLPHVVLPFDDAVGGPLLETALEPVADWPAPMSNIWFPAYRELTLEGKRRGCAVILTGGGGDEWLGVTPFLAADLMRRLDLRGFLHLWRTMYHSFHLPPRFALRRLLWSFGLKQLLAASASRYARPPLRAYRRRAQRNLTPEWVAPDPELRRQILDRAYASVEPVPQQDFYGREGQLTLDHALVSMEMEDLHESSRRTNVPVRMPYWDADLVDFLYRTPPAMLTETGRQKGFVRRLLQRRFPDLGFERQKKVLATNFFASVMYREAPALWERLGGASTLEKVGIVDNSSVNSFVRKVLRENSPGELTRVWMLISAERWVRSRISVVGEVKNT
jgi:asparagine synthase (glutamine-hydrolysing)